MEFKSLTKCANLINALFAIHNYIIENDRNDRILKNFKFKTPRGGDSSSESSSDEDPIRERRRPKERCVIRSKSERILNAYPECF